MKKEVDFISFSGISILIYVFIGILIGSYLGWVCPERFTENGSHFIGFVGGIIQGFVLSAFVWLFTSPVVYTIMKLGK